MGRDIHEAKGSPLIYNTKHYFLTLPYPPGRPGDHTDTLGRAMSASLMVAAA